MPSSPIRDPFRGCLLGLAVGEALAGSTWVEATRGMIAIAEGLADRGVVEGRAASLAAFAPIGLAFRSDLDRVAEQADRAARGGDDRAVEVDGARLVAMASALAARGGPFLGRAFFDELRRRAQTDAFRWQLGVASGLRPTDPIAPFGNGTGADRSVVSALAAFAAEPDHYERAVGRAVALGGETAAIAAMAGALSGARLGVGAIPRRMLDALAEGRSAIEALADRLHARA